MRAGIYGDSQFYEGEGRYHLFSACDKWGVFGHGKVTFGHTDAGISEPLSYTTGGIV